MDQQAIGKFIAECRKEKRLTQEELGKLLNVSSKTISRWENGNYMPDLSFFEPLSEVLDVTITELLKGKRLEEKEKIKESDKNMIETLYKSKKEKKKSKRIIVIILLILLGVVIISMKQAQKLKNVEDDQNHIVFKNNYYTNKKEVKISEHEYQILRTLALDKKQIENLTIEEKTLHINYYYSELEMFKWYGFTAEFVPTEEKSKEGLPIMRQVNKKLPFVMTRLEENMDKKFCYLGYSQYGTFILADYQEETCMITEEVCSRLKMDNVTTKLDIKKYCK